MILGLVKPTQLFSQEKYIKIFLYAKSFCDEFSKIMTDRVEVSMTEELKFFLGFQIKQLEDETFISQTKYTHDLLKKFGLDKVKPIKTVMGINDHLDLDMDGKSIDQKVYRCMIDSLL
jgi:hypothetical protein